VGQLKGALCQVRQRDGGYGGVQRPMRVLPQRILLLAASLQIAACDESSGGTSVAPGSGGFASGGFASGASGDAMGSDAAAAGGASTEGTGGASTSAGGAPVDSGVTPTADGGNGPHSPAELLGGLGAWHLTLPTGPSNSATQIDPPALDAYADAYFGLANTGDRVRMVDLFGGSRTSTSTAFARTELRQEYAGPGALGNADWPCETSVHQMHVMQRIALTPLHKPEMSVGQIHDAKSDLLEVRYIGPEDANGVGTGDGKTDIGKIEAHFNNDTSFKVLDIAYTVGDFMTLDVSTDGAGGMTVHYENVTRGTASTESTAFYGSVSGGCYFKAGNYHQACTIEDANGNTNAACKAKSWPSARFETDPFGESVLELFKLTAQ
jgi:hypothetical protein